MARRNRLLTPRASASILLRMIWRGKRVIHDVSTSWARGSYTREGSSVWPGHS